MFFVLAIRDSVVQSLYLAPSDFRDLASRLSLVVRSDNRDSECTRYSWRLNNGHANKIIIFIRQEGRVGEWRGEEGRGEEGQ